MRESILLIIIIVYTIVIIYFMSTLCYTDSDQKWRCSMTIVIGAREARRRFADLLGRVGYGGEIAIVERSGKPMVALIPVEVYEQLVAEREARFQVLDRIRNKLQEIPEEEVEKDVSQAIDAVRKSGA
jgi:prevent-host-death family protein